MGRVSKNNHSCCGAVGVHESCLTSRQEASRCNAILLEKTSLPYWLPLANTTTSRSHHPLYSSHEWSWVCLLPKDIKMPPKAPCMWVLYALTSVEHLKKCCHGSCAQMDSSPIPDGQLSHPNTNGQHSGPLGCQQNKTKWPETFIRKKQIENVLHFIQSSSDCLLTALFERNCSTKLK